MQSVLSSFVYQWLKLTSDDVKEQIYKLAKKGLTPSQIGWYEQQFYFGQTFLVLTELLS